MLNDIQLFVAIGFAAQMVDGALGMAYGLTATTVLLSFGATPAAASASVHVAEMFTTAASGAAHWKAGNVDKRVVGWIAGSGALGAVAGASLLSVFPADQVRPFVAVYLLIAGSVIFSRGLRDRVTTETHAHPWSRWQLAGLGLAGGFLDAAGGGGWGAIVTTSLVWSGAVPRLAIGTVSLSEFLVTMAASATFAVASELMLWPIILGLIIGGVLAAPFAAFAARHIPDRPMMVLVGCLIILLSLRQLTMALRQ